jgi:hypothetical protein
MNYSCYNYSIIIIQDPDGLLSFIKGRNEILFEFSGIPAIISEYQKRESILDNTIHGLHLAS